MLIIFENTTYKNHESHFWKNLEKLCKSFFKKVHIFGNIYLVDKINNGYDLEFATPIASRSATSSLLYLNQF